jgi:hypothetical protein
MADRNPGKLTGALLPAVASVALLITSGQAVAQQREIQRYSANSDEGRLMSFYSAVLAFSPAGMSLGLPNGAVMFAIELSYVPRLDEAQRSAGYDKPEATNLAPVFPRPRAVIGLPRSTTMEVSWLPPVRVFGVTANLAAAAIASRFWSRRTESLVARVSGLAGRVTGPITCNADVVAGSQDLATYYRTVCRNRDSRDYFEPRHLSLELVGTREGGTTRLSLGAGARMDAGTRFDIGVAKADGSYRDPDHPVLELRSVRPHLVAGINRQAWSIGTFSLEAFYAPGSLLTARSMMALRLR